MFLYHLPNPAPAPECAICLSGGGRGWGGAHNVEDGVPTLSSNGVEGRRKVHVFLALEPQGCTGWVYLGEFAFSHLGFPERLRGQDTGGGGGFTSAIRI